MKKLTAIVESGIFQNFILCIIIINCVIMGLETSPAIMSSIGDILNIADTVCLVIFIIELVLKLIIYRLSFWKSGWNIFDFFIVATSILSSMSMLATFRIFRIFRVFRSLRALKGLRGLRIISSVQKLQDIISAIVRSLPSICWTAVLLLVIYYIYALLGVSMYGKDFPEFFGTIGKAMYSLFQITTMDSWSSQIGRPIVEVTSFGWFYFVSFVIVSGFIFLNVVVGIVVTAISEVTEINLREDNAENADADAEEKAPVLKAIDEEAVRTEIAAVREHLLTLEGMLSDK